MRAILWILFGFAALGLAAGFLGALHPAGDAFAVLRLQFGAAAVLLALLLRLAGARAGLVLAALVSGAVAPGVWAGYAAEEAPGGGLTLYQKNLSFRMADPAAVVEDIRAVGPDMVTLQEVTERNLAVLTVLADTLPTQHVCPFARVGGVAVASRFPAVAGSATCAGGRGLAAVQVETPEGPVWLVSIHLHWPWPYRQPDQIADLVPVLQSLDGPVVLGGDFNMVPWGHALRRIERATATRRAGPAHDTFPHFRAVPLAIDHVLAPRGGTVLPRPMLGSDHRGLVLRVAL